MSVDATNDPAMELEPLAGAALEETSEPVEHDEYNDPLIDDDQKEEVVPKAESGTESKAPILPKGVEKSFARLTRQRSEAREALSYSLQENARLRQMLQQPVKAREEYANEGEYFADQVDRAVAQRELPRIEKQAETAHAAYQESLTAEWQERQSEAKEVYADYDQVVTASKAPIAPHVRDALMDSPVGPHIAYQLGKNPEALRYLNSSSQREVDRFLARAEYQIEASGVLDAPKKVTKAPVPKLDIPEAPAGTPKAARQSAAPAKRLEDLDGDAYLNAYKTAQLKKRSGK